MAAAVRQYTDEIFGKFSYWATWLPNVRVRVGDCGPMDHRVFSPEASLMDFGLRPRVSPSGPPIDLQHASQGGVSYTFQLSAGAQVIPQIPKGKAGIEVSFSKASGVVFVVRNGAERRVENIAELKNQLLDLVTRGDLPREYGVVTNVVEAESATVIISSSNGAKFTASAEADLGAGLLNLADAKAGFSRVASHNLETEIVATSGLTPLFKIVGFKRAGWFWGSPKIASLGLETSGDLGTLAEIEPAEMDPED